MSAGAGRRRHSMEVSAFSRPALFRPHFSSTSNLNASVASSRGMQPLKEQDEVLASPAEFINAMKTSKAEEMLVYACGKLAQALDDDNPELADVEEEEVIRVTYQMMINHPLNSNLLQLACEVFLRCNSKPSYRGIVEEYAVFRPVLSAIKNHKNEPNFLGTAMHTLASIAESALSCKELSQSQAYLDIAGVLRNNLSDVYIVTGSTAALSYVLRDHMFAHINLLQLNFHSILFDVLKLHSSNPEIVSNVYLVFRQISTEDRCKQVLLESSLFQSSLEFLQLHQEDVPVVTSVCSVIESLGSTESTDFMELAASVPLSSLVYSSLQLHYKESVQLCVYGFSLFSYLTSRLPLIVNHLKLEDLLRFMSSVFEVHGSDTEFQEAFCRCLGALFEASPQLHMFVGEGGGGGDEESSLSTAGRIRVPIINWIWVVLLSNLSDSQHYKVFESVCLAVYYLGVDSDRLRKLLLDKGGASAIYEGLRRFIGIQEPRFERCLQYGCRALLALIMSPGSSGVKDFLVVEVEAIYDLIDILDNHTAAPDITAEALGVMACLSDNGRFRAAAIQQNVHTRVLNLIQSKPTHSVLVESAIELLIIFGQLDEKVHTVFNEAGIFRELITILDRNMGETITYKCLMLIHILAEEDHLSTYPRDCRKIAWSLCSLLAPTQQSPTLTIEEMIDEADKDGDGEVNEMEFLRIMKKTNMY